MCIPNSDNVQMRAKIDHIPSNPAVKVQLPGRFYAFLNVACTLIKGSPDLTQPVNGVRRADFFTVKFSLNFKIHMQVCGVSKEKNFSWQGSDSGLQYLCWWTATPTITVVLFIYHNTYQ